MTELAKQSKLKRPTAYLVVEELLMLGLLSQTKVGKRKVYSPVHPRRLLEIARRREKQVEEELPELVALYNTPSEKPKIQVFEGKEGMDLLYKDLYPALNNKEEALWFTRIDAIKNFLPDSVDDFKGMLTELKDPKLRELNFGNKAGLDWCKEIAPYQGKNHFVRVLPTEFEYGQTDFLIFQNKVAFFSFGKETFVTLIESENISKSQRALFNWAWQMGKEVEV